MLSLSDSQTTTTKTPGRDLQNRLEGSGKDKKANGQCKEFNRVYRRPVFFF